MSAGIVTIKQPMTKMAQYAIKLLMEQQEKADSWKASQYYFKGKIV